MLEITSNDIAALADDDLRTLVGLLCEAELRRLGLPRSAVTWGGHQDSADSGIDVRVALPQTAAIQGFVPRPATGFQVKKPDMPRNEILKEMRPAGQVRSVIRELADESGAYIIVSSTGSTSHSALHNRRNAMQEAVSDVADAGALALDFYDRTRLATWVRDHPGLIPWVREKAGRAIAGWRSYGAWAYPQEGLGGGYLLDDKARIQTGLKEDGEGLPALEGIKRMRDTLRDPGRVVRLIGLSGVGKTRLVQALFDERVGEHSLDPALALYTNMADGPEPQPTALASDLVAGRTRAILVVDNCPPELHRLLSELCRSADSAMSVITIEYDIREDEPEGTDVFSLEPSSPDLVEKLISHRFEEVSPVDARTIAEFSGGNARIALALAATIEKGESLSGLKDDELFRRLFHQRHQPDNSLLLSAQACSLVYSFQGEDLSSCEAELPRLAALIGRSAEDVYRDVAELRRRDLVQRRNVWRAVLPHAIANRLAATALDNIPQETIEAQLVYGVSARLMKSFSRRLGYLHTSEAAIRIAKQWLGAEGLLGDVAQLNDLGKAMFDNVAPVAPEAVLEALERSLDGPNSQQLISNGRDFVHLIRSIAYEPSLFDRSVALLVRFAEAEGSDDKYAHAKEALRSLFFIYLSGTHAPIEQRLRAIDALLRSSESRRQALGVDALRAILEAWHFMSWHGFEFGARSRDHGYWPRTYADAHHWFSSALKLVEATAYVDTPVTMEVCAALAQKFRGLWSKAGMYDDLERLSLGICAKQFWPEGWIAARETLAYDSEEMAPDAQRQLASLEKRLRPTDLVQKVRSIVLSTWADLLNLSDFEIVEEDDPVDARERIEELAEALGKETAQDVTALDRLLPELICSDGRVWSFARGLAVGAPDPRAIWMKLVAALGATSKGNAQLLHGFLRAFMEKDSELANEFLDAAIEDKVLSHWFPVLQSAAVLDERGLERVKRSLTRGDTPIHMFRSLSGWSAGSLSGGQFGGLVLAIAAKPNGFEVATDILSMRLHSDKREKREHEQEIIEAGRQFLRQLGFRRNSNMEDYRLGTIAKGCLTGEEGAAIAREISQRLRRAMAKHETSAFDNHHLVENMLKVQPSAVLDGLLTGTEAEHQQSIRALQHMSEHKKNPFGFVQEDDLFGWCDQDPTSRYPTIAAVVVFFQRPAEKAPLQWTEMALHLLQRAPDRVAVLKEFVRRFGPTSWSGSRAAIVDARAKLLDELRVTDPTLVACIAEEKARLEREIEQERQRENQRDKTRDERFE